MKTEKDFEELLKSFNRNKVKYCIVGAYAVAFHAQPRYTKDMDILIEPKKDNAQRIIKSLYEFGFKSLSFKENDFIQKGKIIQLGYEPVRIDLLTSIEGYDFEGVWKNRVVGSYGKEKAFFIGLKDLIRNKKISHRKQDSVDVSLLMSKRKKALR